MASKVRALGAVVLSGKRAAGRPSDLSPEQIDKLAPGAMTSIFRVVLPREVEAVAAEALEESRQRAKARATVASAAATTLQSSVRAKKGRQEGKHRANIKAKSQEKQERAAAKVQALSRARDAKREARVRKRQKTELEQRIAAVKRIQSYFRFKVASVEAKALVRAIAAARRAAAATKLQSRHRGNVDRVQAARQRIVKAVAEADAAVATEAKRIASKALAAQAMQEEAKQRRQAEAVAHAKLAAAAKAEAIARANAERSRQTQEAEELRASKREALAARIAADRRAKEELWAREAVEASRCAAIIEAKQAKEAKAKRERQERQEAKVHARLRKESDAKLAAEAARDSQAGLTRTLSWHSRINAIKDNSPARPRVQLPGSFRRSPPKPNVERHTGHPNQALAASSSLPALPEAVVTQPTAAPATSGDKINTGGQGPQGPQGAHSLQPPRIPEVTSDALAPWRWKELCADRELAIDHMVHVAKAISSADAAVRKEGSEPKGAAHALTQRLQLEMASAFGSMRLSTLKIVEALSSWQRRRIEATRPSGTVPDLPLSAAALRVAHTGTAGGDVDWSNGVDYFLRILTDVHRLPLPTYSDPFALNWSFEQQVSPQTYGHGDGVPGACIPMASVFEAAVTNDVGAVARMQHATDRMHDIVRDSEALTKYMDRLVEHEQAQAAGASGVAKVEMAYGMHDGMVRFNGRVRWKPSQIVTQCGGGRRPCREWLLLARALYPKEHAISFAQQVSFAEPGEVTGLKSGLMRAYRAPPLRGQDVAIRVIMPSERGRHSRSTHVDEEPDSQAEAPSEALDNDTCSGTELDFARQ